MEESRNESDRPATMLEVTEVACTAVDTALRAALDQADALGLQGTLLQGAVQDIAPALEQLRETAKRYAEDAAVHDAGPSPRSTRRQRTSEGTGSDYFVARVEVLESHNAELRTALAVHAATKQELVRKLALRDLVVEGLRSHSLKSYAKGVGLVAAAPPPLGTTAASIASGPSQLAVGGDYGSASASPMVVANSGAVPTPLSLEFLDRVENELTTARLGFERELASAERRYTASHQRLDRRLRSIIDGKEKEIIQLQLNYRATLHAAAGSHTKDIRAMTLELERLRLELSDAKHKAELETEAKIAEALAEERVQADGRHREATAMKDAELAYLKSTLHEQAGTLKDVDDRVAQLQGDATAAQAALANLEQTGLPQAVEAARRAEREAAETNTSALRRALATAERKLEEAGTEATRVQAENSDLARETHTLRQQLMAARVELAARETTLQSTEAVNAALAREKKLATGELAEARSELELLRRSVASGNATVNEWVAKCAVLSDELNQERRRQGAPGGDGPGQADADTLRQKLVQALEDLASTNARCETLSAEPARLQQTLRDLEGRVAELRRAKSALESTVVSLRLELNNGNSGAQGGSQTVTPAVSAHFASERERRCSASHVAAEDMDSTTADGDRHAAGSRAAIGDDTAPTSVSPSAPSSITGSSAVRDERGPFRSPVLPPSANDTHDSEKAVHGAPRRRSSAMSGMLLMTASASGPPRPAYSSCAVQCNLLSASVLRAPVASSTAHHQMERVAAAAAPAVTATTTTSSPRQASNDDRQRNADLRDALSLLRHKLALPPSGVDPQPELEPIPLTNRYDVQRQNERLAAELARRQEVVASRRSHQPMDVLLEEGLAARGDEARSSTSQHAALLHTLVAEAARKVSAKTQPPPVLPSSASPDSDYSPAAAAAVVAPPVVDGPSQIPLNRVVSPSRVVVRPTTRSRLRQQPSPRQETLGAGYRRPRSAQASSPRHSTASRYASDELPQATVRQLLQPVSYFAVGSRIIEQTPKPPLVAPQPPQQSAANRGEATAHATPRPPASPATANVNVTVHAYAPAAAASEPAASSPVGPWCAPSPEEPAAADGAPSRPTSARDVVRRRQQDHQDAAVKQRRRANSGAGFRLMPR